MEERNEKEGKGERYLLPSFTLSISNIHNGFREGSVKK